MASSPPQILRENLREYLRKRGEPIAQEVRLQDRGDHVRMSLIKAAYEQYDEVPESVTEWYDPVQNAIVIPLPDPGPNEGQLDLSGFQSQNLEVNGGIGGSEGEQQDSSPCHNSDSSRGQMSRGTRPEVRDND